jgi:hypothetical protein
MATTYLWQHHLRLTEKGRHDKSERSEIAPQVQEFINSGAMNMLMEELSAAKQDTNILFQIILKHLRNCDPIKRPPIARHIYHSTWGQGIIRDAAEAALRWAT